MSERVDGERCVACGFKVRNGWCPCADGCTTCGAKPLTWSSERPKEAGLYWIRLPEPGSDVWIIRVRRAVFGNQCVYQSISDLANREMREDELRDGLLWCRLPEPPEVAT